MHMAYVLSICDFVISRKYIIYWAAQDMGVAKTAKPLVWELQECFWSISRLKKHTFRVCTLPMY